MFERFIKLNTCISKALRVMDSTENIFDDEWKLLNDIYEVLWNIDFALKILCREDTTILKADMLMKILYKKLSETTHVNAISGELLKCLMDSSRRQKYIVALLSYLTNPSSTQDQPTEYSHFHPDKH